MKRIFIYCIFFLFTGFTLIIAQNAYMTAQTIEEPADPVDWVNPVMGTLSKHSFSSEK